MTEKLLKKVEILSELSTATEKGKRLKRLRNLANLSREDFAELCQLNINTLKGWEVGRYGGLPYDGAVKILKALENKFISCDINWLLHEIGLGPVLINDYQLIISEIELFKNLNHNNILSHCIKDDGMEPEYKLNEYVAGKIIDINNHEKFANKICIIKYQDDILVRRVQLSSKEKYYNLFCTNIKSNINPVLLEIKVESIALIERIYR